MATPIIPKSVARINHNMIVGYGELPAVDIEGRQGWGLPDGKVIYCEKEAKRVAQILDRTIRTTMTDPAQLLIH